MINKHVNISVGVYWDDVDIPGWNLLGLLTQKATNSSKNFKMFKVHSVSHNIYIGNETGGADVGCCALVCVLAQEWLQKSKGSVPWCINITILFCK